MPFFDIGSVLALLSPGLFRFVLLLSFITWATARSQLLLFVVLIGEFWCFTAGCHVKSPLFPCNLLSNRTVLHDWRKHKTVVFSQFNDLGE